MLQETLQESIRKMTDIASTTSTLSPERRSPTFPTLAEAFRVWLKIALLSFGGPAGQIAVMHRILVEEKH
jgi:chromate transporter